MLTQDVQDLVAHSKKTRSDADTLGKRNMQLVGEVQKKNVQATL